MNWTKVGEECTGTEAQRVEILAAIDRLEWHRLAETKQMPMSQGFALRKIMEDMKGEHRAVSWDGVVFGRYALLGLETQYANGLVRSYWLDRGEAVLCLWHGLIELGDGQGAAHTQQPVATPASTAPVSVG